MIAKRPSPFVVMLGRLFWMMLGPMLLAVLTFVIIRNGSGWLTPADLAFLLILGGLVLGRWIEFQGGNPQTATGEPATPAHLRRYVLSVVPLGLSVWILANLIGNYFLVG